MTAGPRVRVRCFTEFCRLTGLQLEPGQLVFAKVAYDGLNPADLRGPERELAARIFGGVEVVPDVARPVIVQVKGRDVGGTRMSADRAVHLANTIGLDRLDWSELAYSLFGGPKLKHARVALRFALAKAKSLGLAIESESNDGFTIVRHDGRRVRFECFAASRGGDTGRGVPVVVAVLDEGAFFFDEATGVATGEAVFAAIVPRLLPGGQILIVSSPWAESGLLHTEFTANFGKPTTALAAFCPTELMRSDPAVLATSAREAVRDPANHAREFGAQFMPLGSSLLLDGTSCDRCVDHDRPLVLPPGFGARRVLVGDLGFVSDHSAFLVLAEAGQSFHLTDYVELAPAPGQPLKPSRVIAECAELARRSVCTTLCADGHYAESAKEHLMTWGMGFHPLPASASGKIAMFTTLRDVIREGRLRIPHIPRLLEQLKSIVARPTPGGGLQISMPRRRGGGHGDIAAALAGAVWMLENSRRHPVRRRIDLSNLPAM
ncbi:MAG TPA: hypothetical protein VK843_16995 [Planctomycetota bacterium]|nr:hypothetical protein [Planctomycetota bacterium]